MSLLCEQSVQIAAEIVEPFYRHLIGEHVCAISGEKLKSILSEMSSRPNWRRTMIDIVEGCTSGINSDYAMEVVHGCLEGNDGCIVLIDKNYLESKGEIFPLGYIVVRKDKSIKKRQVISLVCSRRAVKGETITGRAFGSYLMSLYMVAAKLNRVSEIVLEVAPRDAIDPKKPYGHNCPLSSPLRKWYEQFGFIEDPSIALGKDHAPMKRGKIYELPETNLLTRSDYYYRTMICSLQNFSLDQLVQLCSVKKTKSS